MQFKPTQATPYSYIFFLPPRTNAPVENNAAAPAEAPIAPADKLELTKPHHIHWKIPPEITPVRKTVQKNNDGLKISESKFKFDLYPWEMAVPKTMIIAEFISK